MKYIMFLMCVNLSFAQIGEDKLYHFVAGSFSGYTGYKTFKTPESPIVSAFAVGFAKEVYDEISYGGFDDADLLATTLGGVAIHFTIKLIEKPKNEKINNRIVRTYRKHQRKKSRKKKSI
tara:strand:+ start:312 stop:671 length:360 start_codon:yes stop_codon:yes gene_type:complete